MTMIFEHTISESVNTKLNINCGSILIAHTNKNNYGNKIILYSGNIVNKSNNYICGNITEIIFGDIKYNLTFWQLFSVVVIAAVLGGIIYNFAFENMIQDEINSSIFIPHILQKPAAKIPLKTLPKK